MIVTIGRFGCFLGYRLYPMLQMPPPEQAKQVPGADHQGMGHGAGLEEVGAAAAGSGEITGVDVIALQTSGNVADGIETVGVKIEAKGA